jgi:tetratricopeptide (TPR) repeat protein
MMSSLFRYLEIVVIGFLVFGCQNKSTQKEDQFNQVNLHTYQAISLLGDTLYSNEPSEGLMARYDTVAANYQSDPSPENLIWLGRFEAYRGDYRKAIESFTEGIKKYPSDARFYRHRGHRYISIREFDSAIADLKQAAELIKDKDNEVEPDGMPNSANIPVSTLHGNIWYHLGLAYYLKGDLVNAENAYQKCLSTSSNTDNLVSSTHWLYMISCRKNDQVKAEEYLDPIDLDLKVIENTSYLKLCQFYKGLISLDELLDDYGSGSSNDAVNYGIANWQYCMGETEKASKSMRRILEKGNWASFGFLAAEADIKQLTTGRIK